MNLELFDTAESLEGLLAEVRYKSLEVLADRKTDLKKKELVNIYFRKISKEINERIKIINNKQS